MTPTAVNRLWTAMVLVLALARTSNANDDAQIVEVPTACIDFLPASGAPSSLHAWNATLSFAACIADASVDRIDRVELLPAFVERLEAALAPSTHFYVLAIKEGPPHVQLRAAYAIALGQVALMTRARMSVADPALRDPLEEVLEPYAKFTYLVLSAIDRAAVADPTLATDAPAANIIRSSRRLAASLATRWMGDDRDLLLTAGGHP
jgi:hypothetical protein